MTAENLCLTKVFTSSEAHQQILLKISITPLTDEIVFARIALTTKEVAELMQKQEKCLQKPLTSCLVPNEILTDGKN